ncbi:MAG: metallophosphoesterase [Bacteroidia bacterium]|nr:metallophosphoesterase [Bacteroidia bacterium]
MKTSLPTWIYLGILISHTALLPAQVLSDAGEVPAVHSNLSLEKGKLYALINGERWAENTLPADWTLQQAQGNPQGTAKGLVFNFHKPDFNGKLYYGFIPYGDSRHPHPVYFSKYAEITKGQTSINILDQLSGRYDMVNWATRQQGTLGYRLVSAEGQMIYDGIVTFRGAGPFTVDVTVTEGPFINLLTPQGAVISFETNLPVAAKVEIGGRVFEDQTPALHHEISVTGLQPATEYPYTVVYQGNTISGSLKTAHVAGARQPFTFAYASDSRSGQGGGERDMYGANFYIMKKIMALARFQDIAFFQFSGDMIDGYVTSMQEIDLQYANWKRAIEPFARYFPVYLSMGNHEALMRGFQDKKGDRYATVDRFPYETQSGEAAFARHFVMPTNGPVSEDGASYDPRPDQVDFPSYRENVFYYTYDNVAVIVLNSNYWYAPSTQLIRFTSGGVHGYLMDQQIAWLRQTLETLEQNPDIDHVFVTQHTPAFPNGGHVADDMWYNGRNEIRPFVAGKPVAKGIIERRDQYLDLLVNKSTKVVAILTGDEHNYARTEVGPDMSRYTDEFPESARIALSRTIWQINNGAAGAPYYAQEKTPWSNKVSGFTTQNALVFFHVDGKKIRMQVLNPDTLEPVDELELR